MPDYNKKLKAIADKRKATAENEALVKHEETAKLSPAEAINKQYQEKTNPAPIDESKVRHDTSATDYLSQGIKTEDYAANTNAALNNGGNENLVGRNIDFIDQETYDPNMVREGYIEATTKSMLYGAGKMIGGLGDTAQFLGAKVGLGMEGNLLSDLLHDVGNEGMERWERYIPEEMRDPEFNLSTFLKPDFWKIHIAEAVPQLLEIIAVSKGAGLLRKGAEKGIQTALKKTLSEGAEATAKKGLRATTNAAFVGAKGVTEVAGTGRGMIGKILTDRGTLTNLAGGAFEGVAGGTMMNFRVSMGNAAEVYNTYKDMPSADGKGKMFNEAELGEMAAGAFANNLSYLAVDALSFGMTFGGGWNKIGQLASKGAKKLSSATQRKVAGGLFSKSVSPLMQKMAAFAGKTSFEGMEETVQESFEEWAKFQAYKDVHGTHKGYQGVTKDHEGFWDYYMSDDSEALRTIAFGAGAAMGGSFNFKELVNTNADLAYKTYARNESLKQIFNDAPNSKAWQDHHIRSQMSELVFDGKEVYFENMSNHLLKNGIINDQEHAKYSELFQEMVAVKEDLAPLNIKNKKALMGNITNQMDISAKMNDEKERHEKTLGILNAQLASSPADLKEQTEKEIQRTKQQLIILSKIADRLQQDKIKLLTGKKADGVTWTTSTDENGNEVIVPVETDENQDPSRSPATEKKKDIKTTLAGMAEGARNIFNSFFGSKEEKNEEAAENTVPTTDDENAYIKTEVRTLEELNTPIAEGEEVFVNNEPVTSFEVVPNATDNTKGAAVFTLADNTVGNLVFENGAMTVDGKPATVTRRKKIMSKSPEDEAEAEVNQNVSANMNIYDDDAQTDITPEIFKNFTDTGDVPSGVINQIAEDIIAGNPLTAEQIAVQAEFGEDINIILKARKELEDEVLAQDDYDSEEEANYVKKAARRKSKKTSLAQDQADFEANLNMPVEPTDTSTEDDVFSIGGRARKVSNVEEAIEYTKEVWGKKDAFFAKIKGKGREIKTSVTQAINHMDHADMESLKFGQMVAINQRLETMFPDSKVYVTAVNRLSEIIGNEAVGFTLAGAIYIDDNKWNQEETFMHEMAHIFYDLKKGSPEQNVFMKFALQRKDLVDQVLRDYADLVEYTYQYKGETKKRLKKDFRRGELFQNLSDAEFNANFQNLIDKGTITMVPVEDQKIIAEEIFAFALEGPLSQKYNKFFEPKDEPIRQHVSKAWWRSIKKAAVEATGKGDSELTFLKTLTNDQNLEYSNAKNFIVDSFKASIGGNTLSAEGKHRLDEQIDAAKLSRHQSIATKLEEERILFLGEDRYKDAMELMSLMEDANALSDALDSEDQNWFESDRLKYGEKASVIIRDFSKAYNKVIRKRFYIANRNKPTNWTKMPVFDKDVLMIKIRELAQSSESNLEFIRRIEDSKSEELFEFNEFLNASREDKLMLLSSMKFIYGNQSNMNSIFGFVDAKGNYNIQHSLGNRELSTVENIMGKINKAAGAHFSQFSKDPEKRKGLSQHHIAEFGRFMAAAEAIKSGTYTKQDLSDVIKFFSNQNVNVYAIMKENRINVNGKPFTVDTVVRQMIQRAFVKTDRTGKTLFGPDGKPISDYSMYDNINKTGEVRPIIRTFVQSLVATNRKFTASYTTTNAVGNQIPTEQIDNALTREIRNMKNDAVVMTRKKFLDKYSNVSRKTGAGSESNNLLNFFYDEIHAGNGIELNTFDGINNSLTKNSSTIKDSSANEQSINEFLMYLSSGNKNTYLMETGRYSDSPVSYVLKAPKIKTDELGKFVNGKFTFNSKSGPIMKNAHTIYKSLQGDMTQAEFNEHLSSQIDQEINFVNANIESFNGIQNLAKYFTKNELNADGKLMVAEYTTNQMLNGLYYSEVFFPSYNTADYTKRSKSGRSPGFSFGKHVKVEAIPFVDAENNSGVYILKEDAERIRKAGGNLMKLGKSYKLLNTGVEHDNPTFKGKNIYDKGFFTVLDEAVVNKNPALRPLLELMQQRRAKYIENNGELQQDLLNGHETQIIYAYPTSSNKSGNLPEKLVNKDESPTQAGMPFELSNLDIDAVSAKLDEWYYPNNSFLGLSGDNFVVQQVMDKESYSSNTPIQMLRAVLTNATVNGNLQIAEEIQAHIVAQQQRTLIAYKKVMREGSADDIRDFLVKHMLIEDVDPAQRYLLMQDKLTISLPALREIAKNTLSNMLRLNGNKLQTPGTIARAKAAKYQKKEGYTNGSRGLAFYTENSDGSHNKGEAVLPKFLEGPNVRARQYMMFTVADALNRSSADTDSLVLEAVQKKAKSLGANYGEVRNEAGEIRGYYIEGTTVIATRIPSHGPQTTGVFEVIDFDTTGAGDIQLPTDFVLNMTGGDYDGDQFFVQHKGNGTFSDWNQAFDKLTKLWLSKEMAKEVMMPIDFEKEGNDAIQKVEKIYGKKSFDTMIFSPAGRREAFNNTLISKGNIGITANLHSLLGMLSAYETELKNSITIDGVMANIFKDLPNGESRTINSAKIFNIILDNSKFHMADKLGINQHTASAAMILRNLGYDLGQIGVILNSRVVGKMNELMSANDNVFTGRKSPDQIDAIIRAEFNIEKKAHGPIKINTDNILSAESEASILELMANLNTINSEIMKFSAIMQGHTSLENNPFILREQMKEFEKVMNNVDNKGITIPAALKENPLVKNYVDVFNFNQEMQQNLDPVYRPDLVSVFDHISNGLNRNVSPQLIKTIHNDIELNNTARMLGLNNVTVDQYTALLEGENNVFDRVQAHIQALKSNIVKKDSTNPLNSISAFENSMLFTKGIRVNAFGNNKFISLNNGFYNSTSENERQRLIEEFNELPLSLKNDLMLYDLLQTGFKGPQSLFHLFSFPLKKHISTASEMNANFKEAVLTNRQKNDIAERFAQGNPEVLIRSKVFPFFKDEYGDVSLSGDFVKSNPTIMTNINKGTPVFFRYKDLNNKELIAHFHGFRTTDIADLKDMKPADRRFAALRIGAKNMTILVPNQFKGKIGMVALPDVKTPEPLNYNLDRNPIESIEEDDSDIESSQGMARREQATDYYNFTSKLSFEDFVKASDLGQSSLIRKRVLYQDYERERGHALAAFKKINYDTVRDMTDEKLIELYSSKKLDDGEPGYGHRNKFAYSIVMRPIILEIAKRNGTEQSALTGRFYGNKDIGFFHSYLMSNNIPSSQPEIQALVRKMEIEHKVFLRERSKYVGRINEATDALYKEKFGYAINNAGIRDILKSVFGTMFKNREVLYKELYGSLIEFQEVMNDNGDMVTNMKYKNRERIEEDHRNGIVSKAQLDFYNATQEITAYLKPFALQNGKEGREDYIPHTAPAWMEIKARRGMLGLAVNSKTVDERIYDVKMGFQNPMTGEYVEKTDFKFIEDVYNTLSKTTKDNSKAASEFRALKHKAIKLLRSGKNEDGSVLVISNVEIGSAIGDVFMDRFTSSRSIAASDLPSLDLNKAFVDYTHGILFNHGNEVFGGMNRMLPFVDGILALTDERGDANAKKYVEKVWKDYFLGGKRQSNTPNIAALESVGITTDKVINFLTKASLIYWLGWYGLALGLGGYAIGNVLVGKYANIRSQGLGEWAKGEKRFWRGKDKFDITDPFAGLKNSIKILKSAGFMDINIYDDVNVQEKSSADKHFTNLALMPMIWSEKWIQGVEFLGRLTDEEYDHVLAGNHLDDVRMKEIENGITNNHGKGYQPTDQRMLQMYSWGSNMLQFSRYIPTMFYDQFAGADINIYGKKHIGTYTAVGKAIQHAVTGAWSPAKFVVYRNGLDSYEKSRLNQGLIGFGMLIALGVLGAVDSQFADKGLIADANPLLDVDKMIGKTTPPSIAMIENIMK